ncbi:putative short chain dehydrogenase reductase sdr [Diaporthe ampelina]|uniref:Putative short chain dehydrogenase reductase sdr n=1 Tax=Diaporthe ampelina TaxID=1214573 RepID=A0A0G2FU00_9PEZI|nr:putative short chain dehydrogenase reductase sdr [Diaporthe ampelina]
MSGKTYCITGTNRGLGLEFVRQLAATRSNTIIATVRDASTDVTDLKSVASPSTHVLVCDTSSPDSIASFAPEAASLLAGRKIDFVLHVAGVNSHSEQTSLTVTADALHTNLQVNVFGLARTTQVLLSSGALSPDVRVLNMTSGLGSLAKSEGITPRKCLPYSISKAGVNMLTVHQAEELRTAGLPGAVVLAVDPGWVKTRMGGDGAVLEPEESVAGILKVLHSAKTEDNGRFYSHDGSEQPW